MERSVGSKAADRSSRDRRETSFPSRADRRPLTILRTTREGVVSPAAWAKSIHILHSHLHVELQEVGQIWQTFVVYRFEGKEKQFEFNSLFNRKPVKGLKDGRCVIGLRPLSWLTILKRAARERKISPAAWTNQYIFHTLIFKPSQNSSLHKVVPSRCLCVYVCV